MSGRYSNNDDGPSEFQGAGTFMRAWASEMSGITNGKRIELTNTPSLEIDEDHIFYGDTVRCIKN